MGLTPKQRIALEAASSDGRIFQLPERRTHAPSVLAALVKRGYLKASSVGVIWTLTAEGRAALAHVKKG